MRPSRSICLASEGDVEVEPSRSPRHAIRLPTSTNANTRDPFNSKPPGSRVVKKNPEGASVPDPVIGILTAGAPGTTRACRKQDQCKSLPSGRLVSFRRGALRLLVLFLVLTLLDQFRLDLGFFRNLFHDLGTKGRNADDEPVRLFEHFDSFRDLEIRDPNHVMELQR